MKQSIKTSWFWLPAGMRIGACSMAVTASLAFAQPDKPPQTEPLSFSGTAALGAEYNSNLSVSQLESSSGQSDEAGTLDLNVNARWHPNDKFNAEGAYSLTSSRYQDVDSYDMDLHILSADVSYDFTLVTLGTNYYYALAYLGGNSFLTLDQYSVYAGKLLGKQWYLRGAVNSTTKKFDVFTTRNADNDGYSLGLYRFFNDGRSSLNFGYTYEDEDTIDPSYRYTADSLRFRFNQRFMFMNHESKLQVGYRWQDRSYLFDTPSINAPRDDSQQVAEAKLEVSMTKQLSVIGHYEHGDYSSRLPSANFTENLVSLAMQLSF